jgi:signal transduction histidine kinase
VPAGHLAGTSDHPSRLRHRWRRRTWTTRLATAQIIGTIGQANADPASTQAVIRAITAAVTRTACSRATGASVLIGYGPDRLTVQVDDDGPSVTAAPEPATGTELASGTGIAGMRERAAALGGRFSADSRPGGGYRVRAEFPVEARGGST